MGEKTHLLDARRSLSDQIDSYYPLVLEMHEDWQSEASAFEVGFYLNSFECADLMQNLEVGFVELAERAKGTQMVYATVNSFLKNRRECLPCARASTWT